MVLALAGWAIADTIDVPSPTQTTLVVADATTSSVVVVTTLEEPTGSPPTTTGALTFGGDLSISESVLDLGETQSDYEIQLTNNGEDVTSWMVVTEAPGITVEPSGGEVEPGVSVGLVISLDRSLIAEGDYSGSFRVEWDGGNSPVAISASKQVRPIIQPPKADPGSIKTPGEGCSPTLTTISARVIEETEIAEAYVRWSGNGTTTLESAMALVGEDRYEAKIGPFTNAGSFTVRVIATDVFENSGGASITVTVLPCP